VHILLIKVYRNEARPFLMKKEKCFISIQLFHSFFSWWQLYFSSVTTF